MFNVGLSFLSKEEYLSKDPNKTYYKALLMKYGFSTGANVYRVWESPCAKQLIGSIYKEELLREINFFKAYLRKLDREI
jgi:hypothetical protein